MDDSFFTHRKIRMVSPLAKLLDVAAFCFCAQSENDGLFHERDVNVIAALADVKTPQKYVAELVEVGLWEHIGQGYAIHNFLEYNPSHEILEEKRRATKARVAKHRSKGNGVGNGGGNSVTDSVSHGVTNGVGTPSPDPLSVSGSSSISVSDPDQSNSRAKRPGGHDIVALFGRKRLEVFPNTLPWNTARDTKGDAGSFAALLSDDDIADLEPTMLLALGKIKSGAVGWTNPELSVSPSFAFGKWKDVFTALREELHGRAPVVARPEQTTGFRRPAQATYPDFEKEDPAVEAARRKSWAEAEAKAATS